MKKTLISLLMASVVLPAVAASEHRDPRFNAGGFLARTQTETLKNRAPVRMLQKVMPGHDLQPVVRQAQSLMRSESTMSVLLLKEDRIIFEGYNAPSGPHRPQFSYSMSKSLTAMTIGAMACRGDIPSIDAPAETIATALKGTLWGRATVRHLLAMKSGVADSGNASKRYRGEITDLMMGRVSGQELLRRYGQDSANASGETWRYSNADTMALGQVAEARGGMVRKFRQYVWDRAGTESPGHWIKDPNGHAVTASGFGATTRDWGRLALLSLQMLRDVSDPCMSEFMRVATSTQSEIHDRNFSGYGYQTWTDPKIGSGYWWVGHSGQRIAVEPDLGIVMVVTSRDTNHLGQVYSLWGDFVRAAAR